MYHASERPTSAGWSAASRSLRRAKNITAVHCTADRTTRTGNDEWRARNHGNTKQKPKRHHLITNQAVPRS